MSTSDPTKKPGGNPGAREGKAVPVSDKTSSCNRFVRLQRIDVFFYQHTAIWKLYFSF